MSTKLLNSYEATYAGGAKAVCNSQTMEEAAKLLSEETEPSILQKVAEGIRVSVPDPALAFKTAVADAMYTAGNRAYPANGGIVKAGDTVEMIDAAPDRPFTAAWITLSDKGAAGEREDKSGPLIGEILTGAGYNVVEGVLIPDEPALLKRELMRLSDQRQVNVIFTTGGTGFSKRDRTPEATAEVCERMTPGISEAIRAYSMTKTPTAMLSRATAGIRRETLIINLPGSPKAVRECLEFLLHPLEHGLEIMLGRDDECAGTGSADK